MSKLTCFTLIYFFLLFSVNAQVTWADEVLDYSSQYGEIQYSASQLLGAPTVLPAMESNVTAWSARWPDIGIEKITVKFSESVETRQVIIAESYNPGAVSKVVLMNENGKKQEINADETMLYSNEGSGILALKVDPPFSANSLQLVLNTAKVEGYNHIDAVGISSSSEAYIPPLHLDGRFQDLQPKPMESSVNSSGTELNPIPAAGGTTLFFTRKGDNKNYGSNDQDDIWVSYLKNNEWSVAKNLGTPINTVGQNNLHAFISSTGMAYCAGNLIAADKVDRLYTCQQTPSGWEAPVELNITDFYNQEGYTSFHVSADEKVMVLSLQQEDSKNSKDLYVSFRKADRSWSKPKNMGPMLNTIADEATPFISSDGNTLFFSSKGFPGYGGFDLYVTRRLDDSWLNWSQPKNLGQPINTAQWDYYLSIADSNGDLFFARYVGNNNTDIFWATPPKEPEPAPGDITFQFVNATSGNPILGTLQVEGSAKAPIGPEMSITVPASQLEEYEKRVEVSAEGYFSTSYKITATDQKLGKATIALYSLEEGAVVPLQNIFFEVNKSKLKPESFEELDNLAKFLKSHKEVKVEIAGHTNDLCSSSFCKQLSTNRAKAVTNYLRSQGVQKEQVSYMGYGKQQPIDTNETDAGRKKNQRVEVRVISVEE